MNKPTKPNITIPEAFAIDGIKTDFTNEKLQNGYDRLQPDVLAGDNLNKFIDDTYKGLNYGIAAGDAINLIQEGETLTVQNGKLVSGSTGGSSVEITYADNTTADLETVKYQTKATYEDRTSFPNTQMDVVEDIGDNYNPLYFANVKIISVKTPYTFTQNGTFFAGSASIATIKITKNGSSFTLYSTTARIPRGCSFTTSVAGKFCFDDNYYGYLAN